MTFWLPLSLLLSGWTPIITLLLVLPLVRCEKDYHRAALYLLSFFAVLVVVAIVKATTGIPRPEDALVGALGSSFPSGHAAMGAFPLGFYWFLVRWPSRTLLATYAVVVALSRLVLGVHYPIDVIAGGFLGFTIPYTIMFFEKVVVRQGCAILKRSKIYGYLCQTRRWK